MNAIERRVKWACDAMDAGMRFAASIANGEPLVATRELAFAFGYALLALVMLPAVRREIAHATDVQDIETEQGKWAQPANMPN